MGVVKNLMVRAGADFSGIRKEADRTRTSMQSMQSSLSEGTGGLSRMADGLKRTLAAVGVAVGAAEFVRFAKDAKSAYDVQAENETKLARVMQNTMGASAAEIKSIIALTNAQQRMGVVGADVQLGAAQELATYLEESESLRQLIPVLNDMTAQQYGLNASQEQATNIATMLGKVMEGQTGGLSRYGYYFTEAEKAVLQYGTEAERVAVLSKIVESSVGGMNAALASTPSGRLQQVSNALGDIKTQFGLAVSTVLTVFLPAMNAVVSVLSAAATLAGRVAQSIANVFGAKGGTKNVATYAAAAGGATVSMGKLKKSTEAAGAAAKKLSTAGFDTLQKLSGAAGGSGGKTSDAEDADDGGGAGISALSGLPVPDMSAAVEGIGWLEKGLVRVRDLLDVVKDRIGDISDLIHGRITFAEFIGELTPLEEALLGIGLAVGLISFVSWISSLSRVGGLLSNIVDVFKLMIVQGVSLKASVDAVFGPGSALFGAAALIAGLTTAALAFVNQWQNGMSIAQEAVMLLGIAIAGVGAVILGVPAAVATAVGLIVATVATAVLFVKEHFAEIKQDFVDSIESIKASLKNFWTEMKGELSAAWAWLKEGFRSLVNGVISFWEGLLNAGIRAVNGLISGLNGIKFTVPEWVPIFGGKTFAPKIPSIPSRSLPRLARGAVIDANRPFAAVLGDQKSGRNIETPERLLRDIVRDESANGDILDRLDALIRAVKMSRSIRVSQTDIGRSIAAYNRRIARNNG